MSINWKFTTLLVSSTILAGMPGIASAQDVPAASEAAEATPTGGLEEIVVTARRDRETLMDVPVAVSSISDAAIERSGATDLGQIARMAPQVSIARAESGTGAIYTIRGVGTPALDSALEQSVTLMVDGVPGNRGQIVNLGFFDLDGVEVLKGPQALFFGKNSPAGVISLTSKGPGSDIEGYVRAGYEFRAEEKYLEAAIGGPLTDTLGARVAVRVSDMEGWLDNVATGYAAGANPFYSATPAYPGAPFTGSNMAVPGAPDEGNYRKEFLGRLTLAYNPTDSFEATLKVAGGKIKSLGTAAQAFCFNPDDRPTGFGISDPQQDCRFDGKLAQGGLPQEIVDNVGNGFRNGEPFGRDTVWMGSLAMNYKIGDDLTLSSVTGYSDVSHSQLTSYNYTSLSLINFATKETGRSFSQEVRLVSDYDAPVNFSLGGYYEDLKRSAYADGIYILTPPDPVTGRYDTAESLVKTTGETLSVFGQVRWAPIEQIEVAGGVRYTHEKRASTLNQIYGNPFLGFFNFIPNGDAIAGKFSADNWSPEITVSYKPSPDALIYAAYKTGFKSGGISSPSFVQANLTADPAECADPASTDTCLLFNNEKVKGFEVGAKTYLADRTIRLQATAYSYLYSNLQVSSFNQQTSSFFIQNAASARVKGIELQGEWAPVDGLRLNASGTYNSAKYKAFPTAQCYFDQNILEPGSCPTGVQDLAGRRLTRAPKYTFAAGASYEGEVSDSLNFGVNLDTTYSSGYFTSEDHNPLATQSGFWLLNAGIRLFQPDKGFEVALIGTNLTNKYYKIITNSASGGGRYDFWGVTPRTREIKLQGTFRF